MTLRKLDAAGIGFPGHPPHPADEGGFLALTSHKRARDALRFGLEMPGVGFNVFVVGEDRSGRMNATLSLLKTFVSGRPAPDDWVYVNNFRKPHRPEAHRLPAGRGAAFRDRMAALVPHLRGASAEAARHLTDAVLAEFGDLPDLRPWLERFRRDVERGASGFAAAAVDSLDGPERRYAVNLLIDHGGEDRPSVVIEPNPTYRNLFGWIEYVQSAGGLTTDFTMIRAGAIHRANGGVLVLRAEALAAQPAVWEFLKGALRDQKIRIEELHRTGTVPVASAPRPLSIPLDVKVVIVGAPRWYYGWFLADPDSRTYFKVKADICDDLGATPENIAAYVGLIHRLAEEHRACCDDGAVGLLLGTASRWAEHRRKMSSRMELLDDLIGEAALIARRSRGESLITRDDVSTAAAERRRRVGQVEDRLHRSILDGTVLVSTAGDAIGQVNALIVFNRVDHQYGCPCRVTARSWVGKHGVINIERDVALGGPIQHKGVLGLQGWLAGTFAREAPVSFSCSVTFEQNYGGIEGDSASLAELLAILSDLGEIPLRQDLAVTGSINQRGDVQSVSGVNHKIEGFFRACREADDLTGSQGVVVPEANLVNVVLHEDLCAAVAAGRFHLWSVSRVEDAIELFTGLPVATVFARVAARLAAFEAALARRVQPA